MASNSNTSNNDDFLAKAQAATQRVVASAATQQSAPPEQAKIVQELAQDRPTIQAAISSFLSLVAARSLVAPEILAQQQQQHQLSNAPPLLVLSNAQALQCSRALLKAINATTLCATTSTTKQPTNEAMEYDLVAQVWNGLVASEQKPARFLGRRSLRHAWEDVKQDFSLQVLPASSPETSSSPEDIAKQQQQARFVEEFGRLLFVNSQGGGNENDDDDAALIWSLDGGKQELQRRRDRRQKRASNNAAAAASVDEGEEQKLPFIEELTGEEES